MSGPYISGDYITRIPWFDIAERLKYVLEKRTKAGNAAELKEKDEQLKNMIQQFKICDDERNEQREVVAAMEEQLAQRGEINGVGPDDPAYSAAERAMLLGELARYKRIDAGARDRIAALNQDIEKQFGEVSKSHDELAKCQQLLAEHRDKLQILGQDNDINTQALQNIPKSTLR